MKETELINLRGKREKHFLQENGDIVAKVYDDNIHFIKNGIYEEIDNTLIKEDDYYFNKDNSFKVQFKEKSTGEFMKYFFDEHFLKFEIKNGAEKSLTISNNNTRYAQQVMYNEVFNNIDFVYDILPTTVKENIFINNPSALNEKICFKITSDLDLCLNEDNSVNVGNILNLEKPFIVDSNGKKCNNVFNFLIKENDYYILEIKLDADTILKENLKFPIVIDPTIINYGDNNSVYDTYIYPDDTNDVRYNKEYLKVGVESNGKVNRTLIKFDLPKIGTGNQIIEAELNLRGYPDLTNSYASDIVTIHRITEPWTESEANWNNMNDKYDSRIEAAFESSRNYYYDENNNMILSLNGDDLTNLVKKWYSMYPNYGLMLKTANEVYNESVIPMFFSKNNTVSGGNPKPLLIIKYKNHNGLEDYMDYKTIPFVNGNAYINSYNGNITTKFEIGKTIKGLFPIILDLVYNTNDVVLENNVGYGKGYKLNLQQTIKPVTIDGKDYLEYVDEDGTIHYFINNNGEFIDEDGLNLIINQVSNLYVLRDKNNNIKKFEITNNVGYLIDLEDTNGNVVSIEYNNDFTISRVTDANNKQINISYETNMITISSPDDTVYLNYDNNKISSIVRRTGITYINYDFNDLISNIVDENSLKVGFEYYSQEPYRVKKVCEYATDDTVGNYYNITYNYNSTTIKNNNDNVLTMTFNDNGSIESNSNLSSGEDVFNAYGRIEEYSNPIEIENDLSYLKYKNKLLSVDLPCRYVKNYLSDSSFENNNTIFSASSGVNLSITTEQSNTGLKSLKAISSSSNQVLTKTISIEKGIYYTFSASIKNSANVKISLSYTDSSNDIVEEVEEISSSSDFERYDVSINYPSDATSNLILKIYLVDTGITYIDDVQLEEGEVANPYNLLDNSDFSNGLTGWNLEAMDLEGNNVSTNDKFEIVTLSTGKKALRVKMNPLYNTAFSKTFNIAGKTGDTYKISFWYKNKGLKGYDGIYSRTSNKVIINFNYTNTEYGHGVAPSKQFNPNENEWQYFSTSFTAEHDFDSMYLDFFQTFNANDFYITNLYVMKDYRTINYEYDENGNITSVNSLNNKETTFNYNSDNELIKILSPNGNSFKYEYNKVLPSKINTAFSAEGILTKFKYDENGNPITTKIISSQDRLEIIGSGLVKIRIKGTNKYVKLSRQDIIVTDRDCNHNYWYVDSSNEVYDRIFNPVLINCFLGIDNNNHVSTEETNLTIYYNDDDSVYIKKYGTNKCLKYDENLDVLTVDTLNEDDDSYKFYIEQTEGEKFIENNATYSEDGRFVTSITDSMVNTTLYQYDNNTGLLLSKTNPKGIVTEYTYNNKQQLVSIEENNNEVSFVYNNDNSLSKIELNNKEYNFEYDKFLNIKNFKINNNILINNIFQENNGNLIASTYGNGQTINFNYDDFGRLNQIIKYDDTFNYKYDNNGNLAKVLSNDDSYKYDYDLSKRIKKYQYNNFKVRYKYNDDLHFIYKNYELDNSNHSIDVVYDDNVIINEIIDNFPFRYYYDSLNRLIESNTNQYTYKSKGKRTSLLVESITNSLGTYFYKYDKMNNITHIYLNGNLINRYYYDNSNQLIKEENYLTNITTIYSYDLFGNILSKSLYNLLTDILITQKIYEYSNLDWKDQLTKYDNETIVYDNIGNPTNIGNNTLVWINGRQLYSYNGITFKYNKDGLRIKKMNNNVETNYYLEGNKIIFEKRGNDVIYYIHSDVEDLIGFNYNNNTYRYIKNLQHDIIGILDSNDNVVVKYTYDSLGNILSIKDSNDNDITNPDHIGLINPFRYRSYYYDSEINLYYLNNRYYSPEFGRFINEDGLIEKSADIHGYNLYSYSNNNFINKYDPDGDFPVVAIMGAIVVGGIITKKVTKDLAAAKEPLLPISSRMMQIALNSKMALDSKLDNKTKNLIIDKTQNAPELKSIIQKQVSSSKNGKFEKSGSLIFESDEDLFASIHKADYELSGIKVDENINEWIINVKISDTYDFAYDSDYNKKYTLLNNGAWAYQNTGLLTTYRWDVEYSVCYLDINK